MTRRRITDRQLRDAAASAANIARLIDNADQRTLLRRINDHTYNGLTAAAYDSTVVTSSGHSDPTATAAVTGQADGIADAALFDAWLRLGHRLEHRLPGLTRPTTASKEEAEGTDVQFDSDAVTRPGAGACAACGREFIGGHNERDRVRAVPRSEGRLLCHSHRTGFSASRDPIDVYINRIRLHWTTDQLTGDNAHD